MQLRVSTRGFPHAIAAIVSGAFLTILAVVLSSSAAAANPKLGTITVASMSASPTTTGTTSYLLVSGCGFRTNSTNYGLVITGPASGTSSDAFWVDYFPVDQNGCGSAIPTWSGPGVSGTFSVYVAYSPSGNLTSAQPASNVVSVYLAAP